MMVRLKRALRAAHELHFLAPAAGIALLVAACGSAANTGAPAASSTAATSATSSTPTASAPPTAAPTAAITVAVGASSLGQILTDAQGRTLYLFEKDTGTMSTCYTSCAAAWPPLLTTAAPTAGSGASANLLGTTSRSDGTKQVTYNGHPLYYFVGDHKPGDTTGNNINQFGGGWDVLSPAGTPAGG